MKVWAVVPVKRLQEVKQRLSGVLSSSERERLYIAMLSDVLNKLSKVASINGIYIVSPDKRIATALKGQKNNVQIIKETGPASLNGAIRQARKYFQNNRLGRMLVIPGDLPLLNPRDLEALLQESRETAITIVPDKHWQGTNGLLLNPHSIIRPCFGADSFQAHIRQAQAKGVPYQIFYRTSLTLDIDCPEDLNTIFTYGAGTESYYELRHLMMVRRIKGRDRRQRLNIANLRFAGRF